MSDTNPSAPKLVQKRYGLVADWHWIVNHSWSVQLLVLAFVLSAAEVALPLLLDTPTHPILFAAAMGLLTIAALVARVVAQREIEQADV